MKKIKKVLVLMNVLLAINIIFLCNVYAVSKDYLRVPIGSYGRLNKVLEINKGTDGREFTINKIENIVLLDEREDAFIFAGVATSENKSPVVIKVLNPKSKNYKNVSGLVEREVKILQDAMNIAPDLATKYMPRLLGYGKVPDNVDNFGIYKGLLTIGETYLIEEKIDGENIFDKAERLQRLGIKKEELEKVVISDLLSCAKALEALNQRGIFHRDIGADEIFVLPNGQIKFVDWALSETPNIPIEERYKRAAKRGILAPDESWFEETSIRERVMFSEVGVYYATVIPSTIVDAPHLAFGYKMIFSELYKFFDDIFQITRKPMKSISNAEAISWKFFIEKLQERLEAIYLIEEFNGVNKETSTSL